MVKRLMKQSTTGIKNRIDLGFASVKIEWVDDRTMRLEAECDDDEETPDGMWVSVDGTVYLLKTQSVRKAQQILLHELAHAMLDLYHEVS